VHDGNNLRQSSLRLIMAVAAVFGFDVWSEDIRQAYLQAAEPLLRDVYIRPPSMSLGTRELLKLLRPLYGLSESGDYLAETLQDHHLRDLRMNRATGDFAVFFRRIADRLIGLSATYVDDIFRAGNNDIKEESQRTAEMFDLSSRKVSRFNFTGVEADTTNDRRKLSQHHYIAREKNVDKNASFQQFRSLRAQLAWLVNTRPEIAFLVSRCTQVTEQLYEQHHLKTINNIMEYVKLSPHLCLQYPSLDMDSPRVVVYTDASFSNDEYKTSQIGYIIMLADESK
jgi:Reverse transcriptase (RNA-dependent DNA polymerase)